MDKKVIAALEKCSLFNKLSDTEINTLAESQKLSIKSYHKDGILRFQGDEYHDLLFVIEGEVAAEIISPDGKKIIIETMVSGCALASGVLFAMDNTLPVTIRATKKTHVLSISKHQILKFCQMSPGFMENYLQDSGDKVVFLAEKIRLFKFKQINQKIAGYLLNLSRKQGSDSIRLPYSREQMADLFGVARPSLSRSFSEFYDSGILEAEGKIMHILIKEELQALIQV